MPVCQFRDAVIAAMSTVHHKTVGQVKKTAFVPIFAAMQKALVNEQQQDECP